MRKKALKIAIHLLLFCLLTITTQVGGIVYLLVLLFCSKKTPNYMRKRFGLFALLYVVTNLLIVPLLAPVFGREKIKQSEAVVAHSFMTNLMNRNYVRPELNKSLQRIGAALQQKYPGVQLVYLDANFPFINRFPLLPHLSHHDGKKIDIALLYTDANEKLTNKKPSISGYGVYEGPKKGEYNQTKSCLNHGNWQYDFTKYATFGTLYPNLTFAEKATKDLILEIVKQASTGKLFIEPHLKTRLRLKNKRI